MIHEAKESEQERLGDEAEKGGKSCLPRASRLEACRYCFRPGGVCATQE
jgi:hypothetical protein